MDIINPGAINNMSVIISVCGVNFCSMVSDGRLISIHGNEVPRVESDRAQKVFKLNDRVLWGAAGLFLPSETVTTPVDAYKDKAVISTRMAVRAAEEYLRTNRCRIPPLRNYLVGGKDNKGRFCLFDIHFDAQAKEPIVTDRTPDDGYGISCCLPPSLRISADDVMAAVSAAISSSTTHEEMLKRIAGVIKVISKADNTVGQATMSLSVV